MLENSINFFMRTWLRNTTENTFIPAYIWKKGFADDTYDRTQVTVLENLQRYELMAFFNIRGRLGDDFQETIEVDWISDVHENYNAILSEALSHRIVNFQVTRYVNDYERLVNIFSKNIFIRGNLLMNLPLYPVYQVRPCGLMDKASDFGSEDCRFESCHGRLTFVHHIVSIESLLVNFW